MPAVDVHAHVAVPAVEALIAGEPGHAEQQRIDAATLGEASIAYNRAHFGPVIPRLTDLDVRLAAMDKAGVDIQAVSPGAAVARLGRASARRADRRGDQRGGRRRSAPVSPAGCCRWEPSPCSTRTWRWSSCATRSPPWACGACRSPPRPRRAWNSTTRASPSSGRRPRTSGAAVLIHPWGCTLGSRLNAYYLFNTVGNPVETALALSRIIFSGLLERHPGLKIWSAHGGGYLPSYIVRADHAWSAREDARTTQRPPSELLRQTFADSLVYTPGPAAPPGRRDGTGPGDAGQRLPLRHGRRRPGRPADRGRPRRRHGHRHPRRQRRPPAWPAARPGLFSRSVSMIAERVLIQGGGIGGLIAATALAQRGVEVDVAGAPPSGSVLGVGLIQPANALRVMAEIGVLDECLDAGYQGGGLRVIGPDGTVIAEATAPVPDDLPVAASSLQRRDLCRILLDAAVKAGARALSRRDHRHHRRRRRRRTASP